MSIIDNIVQDSHSESIRIMCHKKHNLRDDLIYVGMYKDLFLAIERFSRNPLNSGDWTLDSADVIHFHHRRLFYGPALLLRVALAPTACY